MSWLFQTELEKNFQAALDKKANQAFISNGQLSTEAKTKLNQTVVKGRDFLVSIKQLISLSLSPNKKFYDGFLIAATNCLEKPSENNFSQLNAYLKRLKLDFPDASFKNRAVLASNLVIHSITAAAGIGGIVMSTMAIQGLIAGSFVVAMGPWGMAALAVGFALASLFVAAFACNELYKNVRACRDSQLNEISGFVEYIAPNSSSLRENVEPVNERLSNLIEVSYEGVSYPNTYGFNG
ncbi:MAG: hypothetical protein H0U70_09015 [Tatlockia sp.]|nr:hypothetical protein [Tatlockia sp.]